MPEEKKTYIVDNTPVDVDIKDVDGFLSANPNAKEAKSFTVGNDTVDVLINDLDGFMKSVPDAKPLFEEASALDESIVQTMKGYGAPKLGKPSAVPSASVGGGSATKGRGVEEPSTLPQRSSEASLDNIEQTMKVYADGTGMFPETLSAADVKELRKQVPGGELPNVSDEKVAKMLAGKSPKQVRIASVNAIPDIKERKTEQARMYLDFSREKSAENQQLDQNITALKQGMDQIKSEGINVYQQLQNPNIDPQTASLLNEQLQQTQANYNQAASDYNIELEKYQQNARFIKTMGAGVQSNLKGLIPSNIWNPRTPSDVMAASTWNATAPALLKTLGAVVDIMPSPLPTDRNVVSDAIFNLADKVTVDVAKYSPQANISLMDDVNVYNTSQLFGNLLGSVAMTFGGGAAAGAVGAQAAGFSQVYGDVYKQGRDAGLTEAESMFFALPTGIVAAYLGDKGVESLAGAFTKTSLKSAIKQGVKELAEKRTPQMMMEFGQKVLTNTLEGAAKEGLQEGAEFATEFGSKKGASLKEGVKFQDDLSLKGFGKGLAESAIAGAAGGGLLGPFFGAGRNKAFADVVNKAARDPQAEADFMQQLDASVGANDITPEQKQQMVEMLEKTKQAAATVPPVVESEPARAEATALVLEQQDLEQQIAQTNPAMAKPLQDRLDEINARLGEIAEGKNLPQEEATTEENQGNVEFNSDAVDFINETRDKLLSDIEYYKQYIEEIKPKTIRGKLANALIYKKNEAIANYEEVIADLESELNELDANPIEYFKRKQESGYDEQYFQDAIDYLEENKIAPQAQTAPLFEAPTQEQEEAPQTLPEVTNKIAQLREQEQAEYDALPDPNDEVARGEIYDKYNEVITPLIDQEKKLKAQAPVAEEKGPSTQEESMASIGQAAEAVEPKAPKKIKTIAEIVEEQKQKKAVGERQQAARDLFAAQKAKGEQIRLQKESDAKDAIEAQRVQRDEEVKQIEAIRPDLTSSDVLMAGLPESIEMVVDRMDANIPTDILAVNEAIDALDNKFEELEKYKNDPKRTHTTAQIDEVIDLLDSTKKELQYYQEAITDYEGSIEKRTAAEGIVEAKTNEASAKAEAKQAAEVEQTPQPFPAQEGSESVEDKFQASNELEQIYRDLQAAVNKNIDEQTIRILKANPSKGMIDKAMDILKKKGIIEVDCN
jgi:hypothetical protein